MFFLPEEEKNHLQEAWRGLRGYIRKWCAYQAHPFRRGNGTEDRHPLSRVLSLKGMITPDEVLLLHFLAQEAEGGCVVEIGSYHGKSTVALALGSLAGNKTRVYAIDPYFPFEGPLRRKFGPSDRVALLQNLLIANVCEQVWMIHTTSEQASRGWKEPVALLWVDGDHSYEGVKNDFACWDPHLISGGILALHDSLDRRLGPQRLIQEILASGGFERVGIVETTTLLQKKGSP